MSENPKKDAPEEISDEVLEQTSGAHMTRSMRGLTRVYDAKAENSARKAMDISSQQRGNVDKKADMREQLRAFNALKGQR